MEVKIEAEKLTTSLIIGLSHILSINCKYSCFLEDKLLITYSALTDNDIVYYIMAIRKNIIKLNEIRPHKRDLGNRWQLSGNRQSLGKKQVFASWLLEVAC